MLENLPAGYEEGMLYGAIAYFVPHNIFPPGYHCDPKIPLPFAGLASQKNYISVSLMCIYGDEQHAAWFREAWKKTGKKLDMGKSCIRIKKIEDVPLSVIGRAIKRVPVKKFVKHYETTLASIGKGRSKPASKKAKRKK